MRRGELRVEIAVGWIFGVKGEGWGRLGGGFIVDDLEIIAVFIFGEMLDGGLEA